MSVIELKTVEEYNEVINREEKTLIDFFGTWCGPCRQLKKLIEDNESTLGFDVYTVDVDVIPSIPADLGIRSIPALFVFKEGKVVDSKIGLINIETLLNWFNKI